MQSIPFNLLQEISRSLCLCLYVMSSKHLYSGRCPPVVNWKLELFRVDRRYRLVFSQLVQLVCVLGKKCIECQIFKFMDKQSLISNFIVFLGHVCTRSIRSWYSRNFLNFCILRNNMLSFMNLVKISVLACGFECWCLLESSHFS